MDCDVKVSITKIDTDTVVIFKTNLVTFGILTDPRFKITYDNNRMIYEYIKKMICTMEKRVGENIFLYYNTATKEVKLYNEISWKIRNIKEKNLDTYLQLKELLVDALRFITSEYKFKIKFDKNLIHLRKGKLILTIDSDDFSLFLPCARRLSYTNPKSYAKLTLCILYLANVEVLKIYNEIIEKVVSSIEQEET